MRILTSTKNMSVDEWRKLRKKSIGGSDAAVILGLNKWKSKYTLWADKKELIPEINDNEAMRIGRDLEEYVAQRFVEATGKKVKRRNYMFLHNDYDFISANVDREIVGENAGLECKTTNIFAKSDFESGEIPLYYYCQCMHYMAVMGYEKMYIAVLVLGKAFYWFEINRDDTEIESLINAEVKWWNKYMVGDEIPPLDGSDSTADTLSKMYPDDNGSIIYNSSLKSDAENYINLKTRIAELKKTLEEYENKIKAGIGEAEKCFIGKYEAIWKKQNRFSLDTKRLKVQRPEIYKEFLRETSVRTLKIKEAN